ncbi:MAG: hypothetical protein MPN21_08065 [Thermoanaerobaculia bacterium]|nr:hypothetical protein [Thermoanaerobaculia bacterium]
MRTADALAAAPTAPVSVLASFGIETLVTRLASRLADVGLDLVADVSDTWTPPPAPKHFAVERARPLPDPAISCSSLVRATSLTDAIGPDPAGTRPIVVSAREVDDLEALAAVTLELDAAWALEPTPEAFVGTIRWVRPTILVAPPRALEALAEVWDGSDRKWSRLRVIVVRGGEDSLVTEGLDHWKKMFHARIECWTGS